MEELSYGCVDYLYSSKAFHFAVEFVLRVCLTMKLQAVFSSVMALSRKVRLPYTYFDPRPCPPIILETTYVLHSIKIFSIC